MKALFLLTFFFSMLFSQSNESFESDFSDEFQTEKEASYDPLNGYNVVMTKFNDFVYMNIMGPTAKGYKKIVNKPIRTGVANFFHNLAFPVRFSNNLLQLKFKNSIEESGRFIINSTFGLAGFIDLAKIDGGLERHNEDFGQTLGFYGVSDDIHLVLPILGASNLRDTIGLVVDSFASPIRYAQKEEIGVFEDEPNLSLYLSTYNALNEYSFQVNTYEDIRKDAIDLYILLKSIYEQRREKLINE